MVEVELAEVKRMDQSKEKQDHADGFPILPQEIFVDILLHLPALFLWEVGRRVCRFWYDIISDPDFIKAHFAKWKDALIVKEFGEEEPMHHLEKEGGRPRMVEYML